MTDREVTLEVQVSKGMAQFIRDHSTDLKVRYGTGTLKEFVEAAAKADFEATLDDMHLNVEEVRAKYDLNGGE